MKHLLRPPTILYGSLALIAVLILGLSFLKESTAQINRRLGVLRPSPESKLIEKALKEVPQMSDYQLPYPGLLPTNPLYYVKMVKERVVLMVTTDPTKRIDVLFHYSNKRLAAAEALLKLGYIEPAITAAIKGEQYLYQTWSLIQTQPVKDQPYVPPDFHKAIVKHQEIIARLDKAVEGPLKSQTDKLSRSIETYIQQFNSFQGIGDQDQLIHGSLMNNSMPTASASTQPDTRTPGEPRL